MDSQLYLLGTVLLTSTWTLSRGAALSPLPKSGLSLNAMPPLLVRQCGSGWYDNQRQCCCAQSVLADIPERECQCCGDTAYRWGDVSNMPSNCTGVCGSTRFHLSTQRCCAGTVVNRDVTSRDDPLLSCCGAREMDGRTHFCCGTEPSSEVPVEKRGPHGCCGKAKPYHKPTTRCHSGEVQLRHRQSFRPQQLCNMTLPTLLTTVSLPARPESYKHVRGLPEVCQIKVNSERVVVALNPFIITGMELPPDCRIANTLELVIKLRRGYEDCAHQKALQAYLEGKMLDVYTKSTVVCSKGRPVLRLKARYNAVIYLSDYAQFLLGDISGQ